MRFVGGVAALLAALAIAPAAAQDEKGNAASAEADFKALSFQDKLNVCLSCHGPNGVSSAEGVPNLAAEPVLFIEFQLIFFRYDQRKSDVMAPFAHTLTDEEVQKFAGYFAALPPPPPAQDNDPALTKAGAALDNGHCEACHLRTGKGDTPRLDGQREDYFVKAMGDYRNNLRFGRGLGAMNEAAYSLSDAEVKALAHYFAVEPGH
jgi:cytochrome c553